MKREALIQKMKEFDAKINLERDKFNFEKQAKREELDIKRKQINKKSTNSK